MPNLFKKSRGPDYKEMAKERYISYQPASGAQAVASGERPYGLKTWHDAGKDSKADIIFVHGIVGNRENTWTHKEFGVLWPKDLLPQDLGSVRILTYGYDADINAFWAMKSQAKIGDHAATFLNAVSGLRFQTHSTQRPLIFVAHSMGGILVQDMLRMSNRAAEKDLREVYLHVKAIAFMGTPHCGSNLADWGERFSRLASLVKTSNSGLVATLRPDSEVLSRIQDSFYTMLRPENLGDRKAPINITCFYEDIAFRFIGFIVPKESACFHGYPLVAIHGDHREIARFPSRDDSGYMNIMYVLNRWVHGEDSTTTSNPATTLYTTSVNTNPYIVGQNDPRRFEQSGYRSAYRTEPSHEPAGARDVPSYDIPSQSNSSNVERIQQSSPPQPRASYQHGRSPDAPAYDSGLQVDDLGSTQTWHRPIHDRSAHGYIGREQTSPPIYPYAYDKSSSNSYGPPNTSFGNNYAFPPPFRGEESSWHERNQYGWRGPERQQGPSPRPDDHHQYGWSGSNRNYGPSSQHNEFHGSGNKVEQNTYAGPSGDTYYQSGAHISNQTFHNAPKNNIQGNNYGPGATFSFS